MTNTAVAIVVDASCDVPGTERDGVCWQMLPDMWSVSSHQLTDVGERAADLTRYVLRSADAVVHAPSSSDFAAAYRALDAYDLVLSIHSSRKLSPAVIHAQQAAGDCANVHVVETPAASIATGLVAVGAARCAQAGHTAAQIRAWLRTACTQLRLMVVPDRFDPLGQRRSTVRTLLAGQQFLTADRGELVTLGRLRTRKATFAAVQRYVAEHVPDGDGVQMAIGHGDAPSGVEAFLDAIERLRPKAHVRLVGRIGPRVMRQLGSRCVGASFLSGVDWPVVE